MKKLLILLDSMVYFDRQVLKVSKLVLMNPISSSVFI